MMNESENTLVTVLDVTDSTTPPHPRNSVGIRITLGGGNGSAEVLAYVTPARALELAQDLQREAKEVSATQKRKKKR